MNLASHYELSDELAGTTLHEIANEILCVRPRVAIAALRIACAAMGTPATKNHLPR